MPVVHTIHCSDSAGSSTDSTIPAHFIDDTPAHSTSCSDTMTGARSVEKTTPATVVNTPSTAGSTNADSELARLRDLEQKRLVLRQQRFSLEQRLYEFCGSFADSPVTGGGRHVENFDFENCKYTGPLNEASKPHGTSARLEFKDGQVYEGSVENGLRVGHGRNTWTDGQVYVGEWMNNSRNGRGTHQWPDGRKVCGTWKDGHLNGKVYFSWSNGATFDGMVCKGKKHGRGIHTFSDGRVYNGHFENGKEHGFGTLIHPDGVKYRGQFSKGAKEGYGIMLWRTRTYDGEWMNNKPEGQGRVVWKNGATYTGCFREGKYHGLGVYAYPSGKKFVGRWADGVKEGHGLYTWPNGKKYDGEYKNGMRHGYGRMTWPDGQTYSGGFENNQRSGRGVLSNEAGEIIHCGLWKDDKPIGPTEDPAGLFAIPHSVVVKQTEGVEDLSIIGQEHYISSNMIVTKLDDNEVASLPAQRLVVTA